MSVKKSIIPPIFFSLILSSALFSGCLENNHENNKVDEISFSIAFLVDERFLEAPYDPEYLAKKFSDETIFEVTAYVVDSKEAMIESLRFGHVDFAMMDAASSWMGWRNYDLQTLVVDEETYGRTYYNSNGWVKSDSDIASYYLDNDPLTDPFSLFEGKKPCHTGWFESIGMLLPMGFLLGLGYANVVGDPNDIESLEITINDFLSDEPPVPEAGTKYYGYSGALRCLSDGTGDIAFLQDSTVELYCSDEDNEKPEWCLQESEYTALPTFGKSPSNALMYNPDFLDPIVSKQISDELVRLSGNSSMDESLRSLLGTSGVVSVESEEHLGGYSSLVYNIPGMQSYFEDPSDPASVNLSVDEIIIGINGPLSNSSSLSYDFLAKSLAEEMSIEVGIVQFDNQLSLIENLSDGEIEIAILDGIGAWMAWKQSNMSVLASILDMDEKAYSESLAIVHSNSEMAMALKDDEQYTDPFSLLMGKGPCFPSGLDSSETLMVFSHLVGEELIPSSNELENISIEEDLQSFFNENSTFPEPGSMYHGNSGALRCLSDGYGEVAFITSDGDDVFCQDDALPSEDQWCLDPEHFEQLTSLGRLPHPSVAYDPSVLDMVSRTSILNSLLSLNSEIFLENYTTLGREYTGCYDFSTHKVNSSMPKEACGSEILSNALGSSGFSRTNSQRHLGSFSEVIRYVPNSILNDYCKARDQNLAI
tara:strand:- start:1293 stop:3410 length:2118 start_codon:yes stop_codon:yes gene_type:complete